MKIAEASFTDIPSICTLVNSAYRGDTSRKGWTTEAALLDGLRIDEPTLQHHIQDSDTVILKATDEDNKIIGCVYLKLEQEQLYLGMLTVSPLLQSKGTGKLLLRASEEKAMLSGCKKIVMTVLSTRIELLNWYERQGYYATGEKQPFPTDKKFGIPKMPLEFLVLEKIL